MKTYRFTGRISRNVTGVSVKRGLRLLSVALAWILFTPASVHAAESLKTESRMPHHHEIPLRDADGNILTPPSAFDEQGKPQELKMPPYSPKQTCGRCHEYEVISHGWHFNAALGNVKSGRQGEPWILTDTATRTQIPLSYRGWAGTFKPSEVGLSDYDFLKNFVRHFPGGGVGDPAKDKIDLKDAKMRRLVVTGTLEIDCLLCHEMTGGYDHEGRFRAISSENYRWLPSIGARLGVYGSGRSAKALADSWRPPKAAPTNLPALKYDRARFDLENNVNFQVTRRPSPNTCYYCHTSESKTGDARWHSDKDVHIRAGMSCVDCHRNGIDHMVVRGYEGEVNDRAITEDAINIRVKLLRRDNATLSETDAKKRAEQELKDELGMVATLSCRGCHYGSSDAKDQTAQMGSRLGAPRPVHKGLPPIHFEKLTCTACHAGPFPSDSTQIVHTSLAHKLGIPAPARGANTAPQIVQSVFLRESTGKIAPHKMVWPSYWGYLKDGKVKLLLPEEVSRNAGDKLPTQPSEDVERDPYNTKAISDKEIQDVLTALSSDKTQGDAVFIAAGKLYRLNGDKLTSEEHEAAKPYAWALAHDVRAANQAVGARGCADCHADKAPIYSGTVAALGPVDPKQGVTKEMWAARGDESKTVASTFAFTFNFRPMLKVITFASAFVVLAVLVSYGVAGVGALARGLRRKQINKREL